MQANLSDKTAGELAALKTTAAATGMSRSGRLVMLAMNFFPVAHVILAGCVFMLPQTSLPLRIAVFVAWIYLVPPISARLILSTVVIPQGRITIGTRSFFAWWALFQLQIVFCRFAVLEEVLRLVPGLYSLWLRLWGARIGRLTYWSPGTLITDRSFLSIGDDVIFGAGVRLNPHVLAKNKNGDMELFLATVKVGEGAMVGGYSLLTAGTEISARELTRAFLVSPPFSVWKDGKRVRQPSSPDIE